MIDKEQVVQRKDELFGIIKARKKDVELLLDFATGYKKLDDPKYCLRQFQKDDFRLISTIKQIHKQIREIEKEYKILKKIIMDSKEEKL